MFERRKVVIAGCSETLWLPPPSSFHHLFDTVHTRRLKLCKTSFCQIHLPPGIRPRVLREEDRSSLRYEEKGEKRGRAGGGGEFRSGSALFTTGIYNGSYVYTCSITKRRIFRLRPLSSLRPFSTRYRSV